MNFNYSDMTRKEAQKTVLKSIDACIAVLGENSIALMTPNPFNKNSWTWKELRDSVVNDTPIKGMKTNPIDDIIALDNWKKSIIKNKNMARFKIHCYADEGWNFPDHPTNTYITDSKEKVIDTLRNLFENDISGIGKIVIEDENMQQKYKGISYCNPIEL